jgi:uncharacterized membrane protein YfcA
MAKHFAFCKIDVLRPSLIATLVSAAIATILFVQLQDKHLLDKVLALACVFVLYKLVISPCPRTLRITLRGIQYVCTPLTIKVSGGQPAALAIRNAVDVSGGFTFRKTGRP